MWMIRPGGYSGWCVDKEMLVPDGCLMRLGTDGPSFPPPPSSIDTAGLLVETFISFLRPQHIMLEPRIFHCNTVVHKSNDRSCSSFVLCRAYLGLRAVFDGRHEAGPKSFQLVKP